MLKYKDGIWAVKGCYHPDGYAVAILRYHNGKKIKKLRDSLEVIKRKFPGLIRYVEEIGFEVPLVPLKEAEILDPFNPPVLLSHVNDFLKDINSKGDVGVTGSLLYSPSEAKDMDFVTFNREYYDELLRLRVLGVTKGLEEVNLDEVEVLNEDDFKKLKALRVLEGVYKGFPYTFKIVECVDMGTVVKKNYYVGVLEIKDVIKNVSLPVMYDVGSGIATSFRTRFTELKKGTKIFFDGLIFIRDKFIDYDMDVANKVKVIA